MALDLAGSARSWFKLGITLDSNNDGISDHLLALPAKKGVVRPGDALMSASVGGSFSAAHNKSVTVESAGSTMTIVAPMARTLGKSRAMGVAIQLWHRQSTKRFTVNYVPNRSMEHGGLSTQTYLVVKRASGAADTDSSKTRTVTTATLADTTVPRGTAAKITIAVAQKTPGTATIYDGKARLKTVSIYKGKATTVVLPKNLAVGTHDIRVRFVPKSTKFRVSPSRPTTLTVTT